MNKKLFSLAIFAFLLGLFAEKANAQASGTNPQLYMYRHNGSSGNTPAPVIATNTIGTLEWRGLTAPNGIRLGATIRSVATNVSPGSLAGNMIFSTSNGFTTPVPDRMIITESGLVGIGTMNPVYHLDVLGNTHTSGDFFGRIHMDANPGTGAAPNTYLSEAYFESMLSSDMVPTTGLTDLSSKGGVLTLAPSFNGAGPVNMDHQLFFNAGGVFHRQEAANGNAWTAAWERFLTSGDITGTPNRIARFLPPGPTSNKIGDSQLFDDGTNVGIGTTTPNPAFLLTVGGDTRINTNLHVTGTSRFVDKVVIGADPISSPGTHSLYVGGSAIAEEVVVKLKAFWPDYVFAKDHAVQPLAEVEQYIETEKHLPGIPSAAEVAENGISLGAMQKAQMEKIEELYLHMIAMDKQVQSLKAENEALKATVEQLNKR